MGSKGGFFVLVEFIGCSQQEVSVIVSSSIKNVLKYEEFDSLKNKEVLVKFEDVTKATSKGGQCDNFYRATVLAYSYNRPDLVALMGTYIKTGKLTTPSNSKRPRIPKVLDSSSGDDDEILQEVKKNANRPAIKQKQKNKDKAHLNAVKSIIHDYNHHQQQSIRSSSPETKSTPHSSRSSSSKELEYLREKVEEQAHTIKSLNAKLKLVTRERDDLIEASSFLDKNVEMAKELKRSLKYLGTLRMTGGSSSNSSSQELLDSRSASSSAEGKEEGYVHPHLCCHKSEPGAVVLGKSAVYVNGSNLSAMCQSSTSGTMLSRNLLEIVFNMDALKTCSVRGRKSTGLGRSNDQREALFQPGINDIIEFVSSHAKGCGWKQSDPSALVSAMGKRLNEIRAVGAPDVAT